jgi:photosystem II stability/assembly factor-like uncharacterized protein
MLCYNSIQSQDNLIWENSSDGLEGASWMNLLEFENVIYELNSYFYSIDTAKSWKANKHFIENLDGNINLIYHGFYTIFKYKNRYLSLGTRSYFSYDKINWNRLENYSGIPNNSSKILYYATDSTFLIQVYNKQEPQYKYRTYITKDSSDFNFVPVETDIHGLDSIIEFSVINDILYATTTSPLSFGTYYISTDGGMNWQKDSLPNIPERIKYIRYYNNRFYIVTGVDIWYKDDNNNWNRCESDEFLKEMSRTFLVNYKDRIITHSKINNRSVLVSSSDGGLTWERFGNSNFFIRQLLVMGNKLIANTHFGIKTSTDGGVSWIDSNKGFFKPGLINDHPRLQFVAKDNEVLTATRNHMKNNIIMKSYDNGNKWVEITIDPNYTEPEQTRVTENWYSVFDTKWGIFAINGLGQSYRTEDFGETWNLYSETSGGIFLSPQNLYERNDTMVNYFYSNIYYSTNKGVSFEVSDIKYRDNLPDSSWHWTIIDGIHYALNKYFKLYKSENDGISWNFVSKFGFQDILATSHILFIDGNKIYFMPDNNGPNNAPVYVTEDFGRNWKEVNLPFVRTPPRTWLKHNGVIYVLYIEQYKTSIFSSSDNCETWEFASEGLGTKEIVDLFSAGDYIYVSTREGLFRAFSQGTTDIAIEKETLFPIKFYPIPAIDIINMKNNYYNLNNVKIYDINGREYEVKNFSNDYFDTSNLHSGIYIAKLIFEGDWSISKKFIIK